MINEEVAARKEREKRDRSKEERAELTERLDQMEAEAKISAQVKQQLLKQMTAGGEGLNRKATIAAINDFRMSQVGCGVAKLHQTIIEQLREAKKLEQEKRKSKY